MAVIQMDKKFNFNSSAWAWEVSEATATQVTITDGVNELSMQGEFFYGPGDTIGGVVESATYSKNGELVYTITDINRSATLLHGALQLVEMTGETDILLAYIFGGDDQMSGSAGRDVIKGYDGDDWLSGSGGDDFLLGGVGNDYLLGGAGDDTLKAGFGDDVLDGGAGSNIIFSGEGNDTIVFSSRGEGIDTIVNLEATDTIQLNSGNGAAFKNIGGDGTLNADHFVAGSGAVAGDSNDFIIYDTDTGALYYDADGDGSDAVMVQFAVIAASDEAVTAADFYVYNV